MACPPLLLLLVSTPAAGALVPVPVADVTIDDAFWSPKLAVWRSVTIGDTLGKLEADGALTNFDRVRDGQAGEHGGPPWYDGLLYETIRGASDFLLQGADPALETRIDGYIERIAAAAARDPGGYVNTYTQMVCPTQRWGQGDGDDNWQHDLYNAGALMEAGVHYYRATGKTRLLEVATRLANTMCDTMGPAPRANIVPGHSIAEEAAVRLYELYRDEPGLEDRMPFAVDEGCFLSLAEFWIENRGHTEGRRAFGPYAQDHAPVLEQQTAEGHAVRATLLYAGIAAAGLVNGRQDYRDAAVRLWDNMVYRRMYITGGLGAVAHYEGFGPDYLLPNDGYLETCAAVSAGFFHHDMNMLTGEARYVDELERVLYNGILAGTSLSGTEYFYENPLEGGRERRRWPWHPCPCCPPMFLKAMGALPGYVYATGPEGLYVNLYAGSHAECDVADTRVRVTQATRYPWEGDVRVTLEPREPAEFTLHLRIPGWCTGATATVNGTAVADLALADGYARLRRTWQMGDTVELRLPMPPRRVAAHPSVEADRGRVALTRGPLVYCLEGVDNAGSARDLILPHDAALTAKERPDLLGGVVVLRGTGRRLRDVPWPRGIYASADTHPGQALCELTAVPYYANANREPSPMVVWVPETAEHATPMLEPSLADRATPSASHCNPGDTPWAMCDRLGPRHSADTTIARFTWWDHRGTPEWAQYDFGKPTRVRAVEVYWWDETAIGANCRVPASWRLLCRQGEEWLPVAGASGYGTTPDALNRVTFEPIETHALRIEAQLQPEWSGGILEWRVE